MRPSIRALNEGANKVVFATVFVTISSHTKAGQDMVKELDLDQYGVPICFSEPLWNSETLQDMFVTRANENLNGTDKSKVGVLLVGHGQPEDWDEIYPTQTEQEISLSPIDHPAPGSRWVPGREYLLSLDGVQAARDR